MSCEACTSCSSVRICAGEHVVPNTFFSWPPGVDLGAYEWNGELVRFRSFRSGSDLCIQGDQIPVMITARCCLLLVGLCRITIKIADFALQNVALPKIRSSGQVSSGHCHQVLREYPLGDLQSRVEVTPGLIPDMDGGDSSAWAWKIWARPACCINILALSSARLIRGR